MDALVEHAIELAKHNDEYRYLPIAKRVAYVVSHAESYASNGYAVRTQGIAEGLRESGFEPICFVRPGRPWELDSNQAINAYEEVNGIRHVHHKWLSEPKDAKDRLTQMADILTEQFTVYRPSSVIVATNHIIGLPAFVAAQRLGIPLFNEVRGFWELSREANEPGYINTEKFRQEQARNIFVASQSEQVFTLNSAMKEELVNQGLSADKVQLVPNGVRGKVEKRPRNQALADALGISGDDIVIGFVGSYTKYEGLEVLIDACERLRDEGRPIKFLFVGDSQPLNKSSRAKSFEDKPWLIQVGRIPSEEVGDYYGLIDIIGIPRLPSRVCELVSPLKATEAVAYDKKLVISDLPALKEACELGRASVVASYTVEGFVEAIKEQIDGPDNSEIQQIPSFLENLRPLVTTLQAQVEQNDITSVNQSFPEFLSIFNSRHLDATLTDSEIHSVGTLKVDGKGNELRVVATVAYNLSSSHKTKKAVILYDFFDSQGKRLPNVGNLGISGLFKKHFRYLDSNAGEVSNAPKLIEKLVLPKNVAKISVFVAGLGLAKGDRVELSIQAQCYNEEEQKRKVREKLKRIPLPSAIVHDPTKQKSTHDLTVACVLDEFTTECMSHEVKLIPITQEDWQQELSGKNIDFLLVESCWRGNNGNWGTITKGSGGGKKLNPVLRYCQQNKIPTVFWNKEDPPHYEKFGAIAALFDVAITTDANMIKRYKDDFGITAHALSFGAQPQIHNPEPIIPRLEKAVFAGSYYSDKPKRCEDFNEVMNQVAKAGVEFDIFDRNFGTETEKFLFPERYRKNIVGNLPANEVWKAHKGYKYQINMNTVQDSSTMFARRVYESLASGTPVISNDSVGVRELFGDLVIMPNQQQSISEQLQVFESDLEKYQELAKAGVRRVMRSHTYGHRVKEICKLLNIDVSVSSPSVTLAVDVFSEMDVATAKQLFEKQTAANKKLFIKLDNFDGAYNYLNQSDESITYAMALSEPFYDSKAKFYGTNRVLEHNLNDDLLPEALEDYLYWGGIHV